MSSPTCTSRRRRSTRRPPRRTWVVLAGDIDNGPAGVEWAKSRFDMPVLYVAGNHEPYDDEFHATRDALRDAAAGSRVQILDCGETVIEGVRFIGCTLWADFALAGEAGRKLALDKHAAWLIDYRSIRWRDLRLLRRPTRPASMRGTATGSRASCCGPFPASRWSSRTTCPTPGASRRSSPGHPLNPAFVSNLEDLMGHAQLWIHGHTHQAFDYTVRGTRIVCNPRGYANEATGFRADLVVEV